MALPKLMQDIFENNGAGPKFLEGKVPKDFSAAISAPGASFTGNVSATTVNATSLVATGESNLGFTRIRGAGCLFTESSGSKGLGMSADLPDGTFGAIVSVRNANDPQNPGGVYFYTRSPESGINITHGLQFRNDGSLLLDGKKMVYVTDTMMSSDHNTWYRKYSDGWIEQGGRVSTGQDVNSHSVTGVAITFPIPFAATPPVAIHSGGGNVCACGPDSVSSTGYTALFLNGLGTAQTLYAFSWFACGY